MLKVTCALIIQENRILIAQRSENSDHPFQWEFPGGKINPEESAGDCIVREIYEELQIEIKIIKKMMSIDFDYGFKKIQLIPFLCAVKSGEIKLVEHNDFCWVKIANLTKIDFSGADKELIHLKNNQQILEEYTGEKMYKPR